MGHFNGLSDDDAELLIGGATVPGKAYLNGSSYGDFKDAGGVGPNPASFYNGGNFGQAKKN